MSLPKALFFLALFLFGTIFIASQLKARRGQVVEDLSTPTQVEIQEIEVAKVEKSKPIVAKVAQENSMEGLPEGSRIHELFNKRGKKLPIVETITYSSRADWLPGKSAWLADYASHHNTSRHFLARSLNGRPDYLKQDVAEGDRFNVFREDKNINFYLLIDLSRSKLLFYYLDVDTDERVFLKAYDVGLGRPDETSLSGYLTPTGKYTVGDKVAIYKPKKTGYYNGEKVEMIRVFGTRWLPFGEEIGECSDGARGLGIHGHPWVENSKGTLIEDLSSLGAYESDGCVRLSTSDIEELFSIVITKPTIVELVQDFHRVSLPGKENHG